jgi:hypothetical protein
MKTWVKSVGIFYLPVNIIGLLVVLIPIIFMAPVCISVAKISHLVNNNLNDIFSVRQLYHFPLEVIR